MPPLQTILEENRKERERLLAFMAGLKEEDFEQRLLNDWTVAVTLAHLAFWDLWQVSILKRWLTDKHKPEHSDSRPINDSLSILSETIPPQAVVRLATQAAKAIDQAVGQLTPAQAEELIQAGLERTLRRSLHRKDHLDKLEKALKLGN
jgi:hypothetical protein